MRLLIQRVLSASVTIGGVQHTKIGKGLLILAGVEEGDTEEDVEYLAGKVVKMRIFSDENGLMNLSVGDIDGDILVVSQFTLMAQTAKGNRPSFIRAARPETGEKIYEKLCDRIGDIFGKRCKKGIFGADMLVSIENNGPVTIWVDSKQKTY
ncbi:MAG: D-tyrosyl-tRNA(Tyr) deacylase [Bacteroidales bacterium]|nr:D-tyrosyl-tRNA(Tyr) deacylase [Bacteroidales bacterium]